MARRQFLMMTADFRDAPSDDDVLLEQLNKALDWIRLTPTSWLLFTSKDAKAWYARFRRVSAKGRVFITRVDPSDRSGFVSRSVWEFIDKHQDEVREE